MSNYLKKSAFLGLALAVAFAFTDTFSLVASANSSNDMGTPRINEISQVTRTTVVLPIKFNDLHKKDVVISVRITNKNTGAVMTQKFNDTLSGNGRTEVTVTKLMPGTKYSFKVKIRRESSRNFSDSSDSRTATTR